MSDLGNKQADSYLWVEKYKPTNVDECILPERIKSQLRSYVESGDIMNYTAVGSAGCGKTSSAKALINQLGVQTLFINASKENGIDMVRNKIVNFASRKTLDGSYKVVILDECLHEDEKVRVGTVDDWKGVALKELEKGIDYPIVSFNMDTGEFEDDIGRIISDKEDDLYEVVLVNNDKVILNEKHPFIVFENGEFKEKSIEDGLKPLDFVVTTIGIILVKSIKPLNKKARVINLTVDKNHTFITENGIVTHNCDYLSPNAQSSLRGIIEEFYDNCRFILTANYENKIMDALLSRCPPVEFNFTETEKKEMMRDFLKRVAQILKMNNIEFEKNDLIKFCLDHFPDFRSTLNLLQRNVKNNVLEITHTGATNDDKVNELIAYLKDGDFDNMRKWVTENLDNEGHILRRALYDKIYDIMQPDSIPTLILILNDFDRTEPLVKDIEIHIVSMLINVITECEFK